MGIDDRDSMQVNLDAAISENGQVEADAAEGAVDGLNDVVGGSGYAFNSTCVNCGEPLRNHVKKCPKCGYKLFHSI